MDVVRCYYLCPEKKKKINPQNNKNYEDYISNNRTEEQRKVTNALAQLLAEFQVHYTNLRNLHWNIKGHGFFVLHEEYEKMYDDVATKIDEVAERILQLGETPEHRFSAYLNTQISELDIVHAETKDWLSARCVRAYRPGASGSLNSQRNGDEVT